MIDLELNESPFGSNSIGKWLTEPSHSCRSEEEYESPKYNFEWNVAEDANNFRQEEQVGQTNKTRINYFVVDCSENMVDSLWCTWLNGCMTVTWCPYAHCCWGHYRATVGPLSVYSCIGSRLENMFFTVVTVGIRKKSPRKKFPRKNPFECRWARTCSD